MGSGRSADLELGNGTERSDCVTGRSVENRTSSTNFCHLQPVPLLLLWQGQAAPGPSDYLPPDGPLFETSRSFVRGVLPERNNPGRRTRPKDLLARGGTSGTPRMTAPGHHIECPLLPPIPPMALKPNHDIKNLVKTSSQCPARVKSFLVSPPSSCVVTVNVTLS